MIEFHLDGYSNEATYLQLIRQVKQSLRLGLLESGDQLPKVREVAEALAINPNTVLKAYRQMEIEGLVEGRVGVGTFVRKTHDGPSKITQVAQGALRRDLQAWLERAFEQGLEAEDIVALVETTMRATFQEGNFQEGIA